MEAMRAFFIFTLIFNLSSGYSEGYFGVDEMGMGSCQIDGNCVSSRNYPSNYYSNENCKITFAADATLTFDLTFTLESCCDYLKFDNVALTYRPDVKHVSSGTVMTFTSDFSVQKSGFKFCVTESESPVYNTSPPVYTSGLPVTTNLPSAPVGVEGQQGTTQAGSCETNLSQQECQAYAPANSIIYYGTISHSGYPKGCSHLANYYYDRIYYNTNSNESHRSDTAPICKTLRSSNSGSGSGSSSYNYGYGINSNYGSSSSSSGSSGYRRRSSYSYSYSNYGSSSSSSGSSDYRRRSSYNYNYSNYGSSSSSSGSSGYRRRSSYSYSYSNYGSSSSSSGSSSYNYGYGSNSNYDQDFNDYSQNGGDYGGYMGGYSGYFGGSQCGGMLSGFLGQSVAIIFAALLGIVGILSLLLVCCPLCCCSYCGCFFCCESKKNDGCGRGCCCWFSNCPGNCYDGEWERGQPDYDHLSSVEPLKPESARELCTVLYADERTKMPCCCLCAPCRSKCCFTYEETGGRCWQCCMGVSSYSLGSAGKNWIISGADMLVGIHPSALSAFTDAPSAFESALLYMQWLVIMLQFSYLLSKCCARQGSCCQRLCCCCSTGSSLNIFNCIWSLTVFELFIALPLFGVQFYNFILNFDNSFNPELSDRDLQCYDATDTLFAVIGVFFFLQKVYTAVMYVFMIASSFVGVRYRVSKQYREFVDNAVELVGKSDYKAQVRVQSTVLSVEEKELVSTGAEM